MERFFTDKRIYILATTPEELTNSRLHDGQSWLQEKLDTNLFEKKKQRLKRQYLDREK